MLQRLPNKRYKFTVKDLHELSDMSYHSLRHRITKLSQSNAIRCVEIISKENRKVYVSDVDPLVLIKLEDPEITNDFTMDVRAISGFFNNPFGLTNAIDMRYRDEQ